MNHEHAADGKRWRPTKLAQVRTNGHHAGNVHASGCVQRDGGAVISPISTSSPINSKLPGHRTNALGFGDIILGAVPGYSRTNQA
jgi:hypothetical protein